MTGQVLGTSEAGSSGLLRAMQVIRAVADSQPTGIGVSALARELEMPKAVAHRILKVLVSDGFLAFEDETKRYFLGPGALTLGLAALRQLDVPAIARPFLESLVAETSETATLSVRQGWSRVYVDQVLSPQEVRMWVTLGKAYPLHAGSSSKAILAALDDREVERYLTQHGLESLTHSTISSADELRAEIVSIRARGYASSSGERRADAGSVAAPILQAGGQVFGSLSVCGPFTRFDETVIRRYGSLVKDAAARISAAIGYLG